MRIPYGLLAVWPPLSMAILVAALIPAPGYLDLGLPMDLALGLVVATLLVDARGRYREFRNARDLLLVSVPASRTVQGATFYRLAKYHQGSWCRRTALAWAAAAAFGPTGRWVVRTFYRALGYRWYHITPDGTFTRNSPFLKLRFWTGLAGPRKAVA